MSHKYTDRQVIELLSCKEISNALSLHVTTVLRWKHNNCIPAMRRLQVADLADSKNLEMDRQEFLSRA